MKIADLNDTEARQTMGGFEFSAAPLDELGASEYTLVGIVCDVSGSVSSWKQDLEKTLGTVLKACKQHPRAENLMLRTTTFNQDVDEIHGFVELVTMDDNAFHDALCCGGSTALREATLSGIEAVKAYGDALRDKRYNVNAALYIVTDGDDNASRGCPASQIKALIEEIRQQEKIESILTVLVGVGTNQRLLDLLNNFQQEAGIDAFIRMGDATPKNLAKLGQFISDSVSSQSKDLNSGQSTQVMQSSQLTI